MAELKKGDQVSYAKPDGGTSHVTIVEEIGRGAQAWVYRVVDEHGERHALKWYRPSFLASVERYGTEQLGLECGVAVLDFYRNLRKLVREGAPSEVFVWPQALTEVQKSGSFGYIMDLIPEGYVPVAQVVARTVPVGLPALCAMLENLCEAFAALHANGLAYIDLNEGNCYVEPVSGKVLVCDNDNVTFDDTLVGCVFGSSGFQAPEVITRLKPPNRVSDYHAEAVLFFELMCGEHPLEGAHEVALPVRTHAGLNHIYGEAAMFVFDPSGGNAPVRGVHDGLMRRWASYPRFVHDAFIKAFSQAALHAPTDGELARERLSEVQWQKVFARLSAQLMRCPHCGRLMFADPERPIVSCPHEGCRRKVLRTVCLKAAQGDPIPVLAGKTLCEGDLVPSGDLHAPLVKFGVSKAMPGAIGLVNLSGRAMGLRLPDGTPTTLGPGGSHIVTNGRDVWMHGLELHVGEVVASLT